MIEIIVIRMTIVFSSLVGFNTKSYCQFFFILMKILQFLLLILWWKYGHHYLMNKLNNPKIMIWSQLEIYHCFLKLIFILKICATLNLFILDLLILSFLHATHSANKPLNRDVSWYKKYFRLISKINNLISREDKK